MLLSDIRYRLEYGLVLFVSWLLRLLPLDVAANFGAFVCRLVAPRTRLHQRALANMAVALPQSTLAERQGMAAEMWANFGRVAIESLLIDRLLDDAARIDIRADAELRAQLKAPGPIVAVSLHLGNWELVPLAHSLCDGGLTAIYRPFRNPYLDRLMRKQRVRLYPGGLIAKGRMGADRNPGNATGKGLIAAIRQQGALGFVCDQVEPRSSVSVPFFGQEAKFSHVPAMVARHVKARIWAVRCLRVNRKSRFRIEIEEIFMEQTANRQQDIHNATAAMAAKFEVWIRETPEQWMWWQRRSIAGS